MSKVIQEGRALQMFVYPLCRRDWKLSPLHENNWNFDCYIYSVTRNESQTEIDLLSYKNQKDMEAEEPPRLRGQGPHWTSTR